MALRLRGNDPATAAQDIQTFLDWLGQCMGLEAFVADNGDVRRAAGPPTPANTPFTDAFDALIVSGNTLTITVGRGQANMVNDNYARREVDLNDIGMFPDTAPAGTPDALTRCEVLIHILAEYGHALNNGRVAGGGGYRNAHRAGLNAQNSHRAANGQGGTVASQRLVGNTGVITYANGATTSVTVAGGNITEVTHTPAP